MMTICADMHEELVHSGDCPACNLLAQLTGMTNERDEALLKLEKAAEQIESLQETLQFRNEQVNGFNEMVSKKDQEIVELETALEESK